MTGAICSTSGYNPVVDNGPASFMPLFCIFVACPWKFRERQTVYPTSRHHPNASIVSLLSESTIQQHHKILCNSLIQLLNRENLDNFVFHLYTWWWNNIKVGTRQASMERAQKVTFKSILSLVTCCLTMGDRRWRRESLLMNMGFRLRVLWK